MFQPAAPAAIDMLVKRRRRSGRRTLVAWALQDIVADQCRFQRIGEQADFLDHGRGQVDLREKASLVACGLTDIIERKDVVQAPQASGGRLRDRAIGHQRGNDVIHESAAGHSGKKLGSIAERIAQLGEEMRNGRECRRQECVSGVLFHNAFMFLACDCWSSTRVKLGKVSLKWSAAATGLKTKARIAAPDSFESHIGRRTKSGNESGIIFCIEVCGLNAGKLALPQNDSSRPKQHFLC